MELSFAGSEIARRRAGRQVSTRHVAEGGGGAATDRGGAELRRVATTVPAFPPPQTGRSPHHLLGGVACRATGRPPCRQDSPGDGEETGASVVIGRASARI